MVGIMDVEHATGSALRRRQRRLRQWLRHERMTVAMALAESQHHAAPWRQGMARARGGARDVLHGPAPEDAPPRAASTVYFNLDDDEGVLAARPDRLYEVRPQPGVLRRTAKQNVDVFTYPLLDVLMPQMGDQLVEVLRKIDSRSSHLAIEVPKIFLDIIPQRLGDVLRQPQMVEQLVHVPTVVSYSSLQQLTAEQIVDIPVSGWDGGGARGGLQGSLPGQNSAGVQVEQTVDIPVPRRRLRRKGSPQGSLPGLGSTAYLEQIVDTPARDCPPGFLPGQSSSSSSRLHDGPDDGIQGVFSTFPRTKKSAKRSPHSGSELGADFTSTLSAHQMPPEQLVVAPVPEVPEWVLAAERNLRRAQRVQLAFGSGEGVYSPDAARFLPPFLPRRVCRYVHAGSVCPRGRSCTYAHHESELHPDSW